MPNLGDERPCVHCDGTQKLYRFDSFYFIWKCKKCRGENLELREDRAKL